MQSGDVLGHYRLLGELGRGGMGQVWAAQDLRLHRRVALKLLPPEARSDEARVARFRREAEALAALNHPHIVTIYNVEEADGVPFLAMEHVEGTTLRERIPADGLPLTELVDLAEPLAAALAVAHGRGVTHRDLKPANVMVTADGRPKILDFGLAKLRADLSEAATWDAAPPLTREGSVLGTTAYMAPEQLLGQPLDARCDLFALGVVLFEMATGRRPFGGVTEAAVAAAILHEAPPALAALRPGLPSAFIELVSRCLEKDPARRPSGASDVSRDLAALRGGATTSAIVTPSQRSLAVLPLDNVAGSPDEDFFAEGMTDALITDLARSTELRVIARTSIMRFRGTQRPLPEIARELRVEALVTGSVLRVGERVRVSAQLVDAASERCLWAGRYDRPLADVLALQDEMARTIAREIDATLRPQAAHLTPPQVDPEVFLLELKGRHFVAKRTEHACRMAIECFHRAIDRDPSYAAAYVGLADSFSMLWNYGMIAPAEAQSLVQAAIDRAAALRADPADIHRLKAFVHWQFHPHDWLAAIEEYERALAAAPGTAILWHWSGVLMGVLGRPEAAGERLRRAAELDPLSLLIPAVEGWTTCYFARRFEAAIAYYRRVLEMDPESVPALWYLGEALTELGGHDEALAAFEKALRLSERMARLLGYYGYACGRAGRTDLARAALAELEQRARRTYVPAYFPALIHAGLGDGRAALEELERSYAERDSMLRDLKVDPPWDRLRAEPRFQALMERMRYPD